MALFSWWPSIAGIFRPLRLRNGQRRMLAWFTTASFLLAAAVPQTGFSQEADQSLGGQVRTEIPTRYGAVTLISDQQEQISDSRFRADGHVVIAFKDIVVTGETAEYDADTGDATLTGQIRFSQKDMWLVCSRAEFSTKSETGVLYD